ncbi:MAG: M12 family metallo-peptidase, partial [Bacteroidota bacterium]
EGGGSCGATDRQEKISDLEHHEDHRMMSGCGGRIIDIAIASDHSMFLKFGTINNVRNHLEGILNNVQTNYDNEFAQPITFNAVTFFISACAFCDPWTSSTNSSSLLSSFRSWGNDGGFGTGFDIGQLWSNRNFDGTTIGLAYVGTVCGSSRYNICQDFSTNAARLRVLSAHEIGHNLSAQHTPGGIMNATVNTSNTWNQISINQISSTTATASCLANGGMGNCAGVPYLGSVTYGDICPNVTTYFNFNNTPCLDRLRIISVSRPGILAWVSGKSIVVSHTLLDIFGGTVTFEGLNPCGTPGIGGTITFTSFNCGAPPWWPLTKPDPNGSVSSSRFQIGQNMDLLTLTDQEARGEDKFIRIADISGRIIFQTRNPDDLIDLELGEMPKGVLFIQVLAGEESESFKIINP